MAKKKVVKKASGGGKKKAKARSAKRSEVDVIKVLSKLLEDATANSTLKADTGACVYQKGGKVYCAVITQAACTLLKGTWTKGGKCP
jgi:hypothetical protein